MNLAWKEAAKTNPDYYLWLNDDTFLFENCLNIFLASSFEKEDQAIIVGTTISETTNLITYGGRNGNGRLFEPNNSMQECNHFNGNVVLIPKSVFEKVGILDPVFHHAIGDFDYGLRALQKSVQLFVSPTFSGFCEGHEKFSKWCQVQTPVRQRLKILYDSTCDCNPKQFFIFENRHFGLLQATKHFITIHIRAFFPQLWNSLKP
jgi:GT2 family glycosyltransferase